MSELLTIHGVTKRFGAKTVLDGLDLGVPTGSIYGFVGVNGAGKTTTMKLILGLLPADAGTITIAGRAVHFGQAAATLGIGYLPDVPQFYDALSAREYLALCGRLTHTPALPARITTMLKLVELPDTRRRIQGFSRGMKQRLGIAQALLNRPRLLIADEPTSALDPSGRREFLDLLAGLRGETTVVMSTHILSDVERICDHVGILHHGRLVASGALTALLQQHQKPQLRFDFASAQVAQAAAACLNGRVQGNAVLVAGNGDDAMHQALARLLAAGLTPQAVNPLQAHLESVFLEVTR